MFDNLQDKARAIAESIVAQAKAPFSTREKVLVGMCVVLVILAVI